MNMTTSIPSGAIPPRTLDHEALLALREKVLSMKADPFMARLAILLVVSCFRNTVLEDYHVEWPQFTDAKMKLLMQQAVDKLNTALHAVFTGDEATCNAAWEAFHAYFPKEWDAPKFDQGMLRVIELTKQARRRDMKKANAKERSSEKVRRGV